VRGKGKSEKRNYHVPNLDRALQIVETLSAHPRGLNRNEIAALVTESLRDYNAADSAAFNKLRDALTVMVYAYIASEYKKEADNLLNQMRNQTEVSVK
jgi:hypothetical protein